MHYWILSLLALTAASQLCGSPSAPALAPLGSVAQGNSIPLVPFHTLKIDLVGDYILHVGRGGGALCLRNRLDLQQYLQVEQENGVLHISSTFPKEKSLIQQHPKIEIWVPDAPEGGAVLRLQSIEVREHATVSLSEPLETNKLSLLIEKTGRICLRHLQADSLNVQLLGGGSCEIQSGCVQHQNLFLSGQSGYFASHLKGKEVDAYLSGLAKAQVNAEIRLSAQIGGTGQLFYTGSPRIECQHTMGRVIKLADSTNGFSLN